MYEAEQEGGLRDFLHSCCPGSLATRHVQRMVSEIAVQLNYNDETSMARDFRKELGISPRQARSELSTQSPKDLLL